jgi:hypothetical protein
MNKLLERSNSINCYKQLISDGIFFNRLPCSDSDYKFGNLAKRGNIGYRDVICLFCNWVVLEF